MQTNNYYIEWYAKNGRSRSKESRKGDYSWIKNNYDKARTHRMVYRAVKKGLLNKPSDCSECGRRDTKIYGHHPDYLKPLDVVWLCGSCHKLRHVS